MSEYAVESALESDGLSDLASFLADTPEEESNEQDEEQTTAEDTTSDADTVDEANDEQEDSEGEELEEEKPAPVEKITVKVKGEDGEEETLELTPDDIASSYLRQKDYTKKTQALATRENEAAQFLAHKHEEMRSQYLSQAELTRTAIVNMAGIKSPDEMAQLANSDPAAWVAEQQRQQQISNYLNQLGQQIDGEKQRAMQQQAQQREQSVKKMYESSWAELQKDGIDKDKLQKIYSGVSKAYGYAAEEFSNVYDHRLVRMMKDATAYRDLQAQKSEVTKKLQAAPRMPSKQTPPAQKARDLALDNRFKSGRAKLNDLAAFLR
jgi:hypothetical protein